LTPNENTGNRRLLGLLRDGLLDISAIRVSDLPDAVEAAATAGKLIRPQCRTLGLPRLFFSRRSSFSDKTLLSP
jgi:hypothetical protein